MNKEEILSLFDQEQRRELHLYKFRREVSPHVVRHICTAVDWGDGMVTYSQLDSANTGEVIEAEIAHFDSLGQTFEWKVYAHDTPADLKERLAARGFSVGGEEAVLVLDLNEAPPALLQPVTHDVRRITRQDQLADVVTIQRQVWPEADFIDWLEQALADSLAGDPEQMSIYVAYVDHRPASGAWITFHKGSRFAGLWGGSTLPEYRRRGLYTALVAVRLQEARRRGVRFLTIDASPMSRAVLEKFGFTLLTYTYPCKWPGTAGQDQ
ncbi:MAG: GNAT family N-acetyltransferase [Chloroflexota bacterium]